MIYKARRFIVLVLVAAAVAGCAASRSFSRGQDAARVGDWDTAVAYYREALLRSPDRLEVRIALERATQSAALEHLSRARRLESEGQFAAAAAAYRRVLDLEATNHLAAAKAAEMDKLVRDQIDAARPKPEIDQLREQVRREQEAALVPLAVPVLGFRFGGTLRELLEFVASASNVNILIDPALAANPTDLNRPVELTLQDTTVEGVLRHLSLLYKLFYRTLDPRTILVARDDVQARQQYEEQSIQTFYLSHAKAAEVGNVLTQMLRGAGAAPGGAAPTIISNETSNTIVVRATPAVMQIAERIVHMNDRPKAEVVIEVSILEVDRARAKQHGLDLSEYAVGVTLSPDGPPALDEPPPLSREAIGRVSTRDLYLTVPSAIIRFLEAETNSRLIAKPNLRGQEGATLTLNLGDEIPIPSTTFGPAAGGGLGIIPISQFLYRPVGINLQLKPRVTYDGEVVLEITVESSGRGPGENVAGQHLPTFTSRKVQTTMRLRDGESNMIAGLLREEDRRSLRGLPAILRIPVLRELFAANDQSIETSEIVMLLTPRIVRTHEISADDLRPINVGTSQNMGIGGQGPVFGGVTSTGQAAAPMDRTITGAPAGGVPTQPVAAAPGAPTGVVPPPNTVDRPIRDLPPVPPAAGAPPPPESAPAVQVILSAPAMTPGTPVSVPVSIANASRVTQLTISVTYDPALLRARGVAQGGFMAQGGIPVTFVPRIDEAAGRIDIAIARQSDTTGASGAGLLASIQFDPIAAGEGTLTISGAGTAPGGQTLPLQFVPVQFRIR